MARLQSKVSSGLAGERGAEQQAVETEAGPSLSSGAMPAANLQIDFASVASTPKGASLRQLSKRDGAAPLGPGEQTLGAAEVPQDFSSVSAAAPSPGPVLSGNHNPVRGKGNPTRQGDLSPAEMD
jgi:hypothetical protein